jgi:hypothetical protein
MTQADFVIRECEYCHEEMMDSERRVRCRKCRKLCCRWCFHHVHSLQAQNCFDHEFEEFIDPKSGAFVRCKKCGYEVDCEEDESW